MDFGAAVEVAEPAEVVGVDFAGVVDMVVEDFVLQLGPVYIACSFHNTIDHTAV
jgi:hypothetical protein